MTILKHKLSFAKEFGWTDQRELISDSQTDGIIYLHKQNEIDISLCNCRRCIRFKLRQKVEKKELELNRNILADERMNLNNQVIEETDLARKKANLQRIYL